jgi:lipopolysaccharide export system protein LptA
VLIENSSPDGEAKVSSQELEVRFFPVGVHPASSSTKSIVASIASASPSRDSSGNPAANAASEQPGEHSNIDQIIATGQVQVDWPDRHGTGEKLVYLSDANTYTLTGTSANPPRITDQDRGTVTGSALIFHSGDDSVTVEGNGRKTVTDTVTQKKPKQP